MKTVLDVIVLTVFAGVLYAVHPALGIAAALFVGAIVGIGRMGGVAAPHRQSGGGAGGIHTEEWRHSMYTDWPDSDDYPRHEETTVHWSGSAFEHDRYAAWDDDRMTNPIYDYWPDNIWHRGNDFDD